MKKHVETATLVSTGNVMHRLMRYKENVHMYVKAGAIADLAAVCKSHGGLGGGKAQPEVVASMAQALTRIAAAKPEYSVEICKSGAIESILKCLSAHPEQASLVEYATGLIGAMARMGGAPVIEMLRKMGAVDVLVAAVEVGGCAVGVCDWGCCRVVD